MPAQDNPDADRLTAARIDVVAAFASMIPIDIDMILYASLYMFQSHTSHGACWLQSLAVTLLMCTNNTIKLRPWE
jgi:hypothetical protein